MSTEKDSMGGIHLSGRDLNSNGLSIKEIKEIFLNDGHKIDKNFLIEVSNDARKSVQLLYTQYIARLEKAQAVLQHTKQMSAFDLQFCRTSNTYVAGVDEVGRGALAGPIVAAAVILKKDEIIHGIDDSKKLTKEDRCRLYFEIKEKALCYGFAAHSNKYIDKNGIQQANISVLMRAVGNLAITPDVVLVDGFRLNAHSYEAYRIIKGDSKSQSIAAASIIAKVFRDRMMSAYAARVDGKYGYEKNAGYGAARHIEAIMEHGPSDFHRISFLGNILDETK